MLMAAGLPLPGKVFAHGWLLVGGEKMSKSKLTAIAPAEITDHFGVDAFRWYFLRAIQFGQDGSFSWEDMSARYTSELANGLGNLVSRVTAMTGRYFEGALPAGQVVTAAEEAVATAAAVAVTAADERFIALDFSEGLAAIGDFVSVLNGYLTEQEPWKVAKTIDSDPAARARVGTVLATAADGLRVVAVLLNATMPTTAQRMWDMLGAEASLGALAAQRIQDAAIWGQLPAGAVLTKGEVLFPRLEEEPTA
jgi:methionyl-tRNA synthetase